MQVIIDKENDETISHQINLELRKRVEELECASASLQHIDSQTKNIADTLEEQHCTACVDNKNALTIAKLKLQKQAEKLVDAEQLKISYDKVNLEFTELHNNIESIQRENLFLHEKSANCKGNKRIILINSKLQRVK